MKGAALEATAAYVGLGANLGDPAATLRAAIEQLGRLPGTALAARSSLWRSAPIDAVGPDFLNAVVRIDTRLDPHALLAELQRLEALHHRERPYPNAPRTLDLDLLLFGEARIETPQLSVPHPRLHLRAFVILPLLEIAPDVSIPGIGPADGLLPSLAGQQLERLPR